MPIAERVNAIDLTGLNYRDRFTYGCHIEFKTSTKMKGNLAYVAVSRAKKTGFRYIAGARAGIGMGLSQTT